MGCADDERAIADPHEHSSAILSAALSGRSILFVLAQARYLRTVPQVSPRLQVKRSRDRRCESYGETLNDILLTGISFCVRTVSHTPETPGPHGD